MERLLAFSLFRNTDSPMNAATIFAGLSCLAGMIHQQNAMPQKSADTIENIRWIRAPEPEAVAQYQPEFASMIGISGQVALRCEAPFEGPPQNCVATSTQPDGLGFDNAAMLVVATGRIRPAMVNGEPRNGAFNVTINFQSLPIPTEPTTSYNGTEPTPEAVKLAAEVVATFPDPTADLWLETVEDLDADRQSIVRGWLEELFPFDEEVERNRSALALARLASEVDLKTFLATGVTPPQPTEEQYAAAFGNETAKSLMALQTLRRRYCARWSCEIMQD